MRRDFVYFPPASELGEQLLSEADRLEIKLQRLGDKVFVTWTIGGSDPLDGGNNAALAAKLVDDFLSRGRKGGAA